MKRADSILTWYGELTTRKRLLKRGSLLLLPGMLWLMLFLVLPGLVLALTNPKGYAVFATLFSGFVIVPDDVGRDALTKGALIMAMLAIIDTTWLYAGGALRHWFTEPCVSHRINVAFAVLLLLSLVFAVLL